MIWQKQVYVHAVLMVEDKNSSHMNLRLYERKKMQLKF